MVVSSDGEYVQNIPILHTLNCDRLLLRNECLPVLLGVSRLQPTKTNATTSALHRINQFILRSQKCSDIEHYWTQATKLLSGSKPTFSRISTFETARVIDRFWMVHNDLICLDPHQADGEWRSNSIFNERSYLHVLNSIIPILVSCFQKSEASQLIKVMISSQLAAEHLSNLAVNLPSLCGIISEVLLSCLRNAQDAAVVWRCSRVLLSIAAKDKDLAICVRTCMVRRKEHPSLCLEVTNKFIHDADSFIDIELCSPSSAHNNSSICSSWLVNSLRDCNLQQISELMVSRLNFLATGRISTATQEQFSETARGMKMAPTDHWQDDIIRCARIISTCSSIRGSCSDNRMSNLSSNSPDFYGKIDMLDAAAKTLITAAHGILERLKRSYEVIRTEENEENEKVEVEFMLRIAIVLLLVGFTVSATAFVKLREDNNQNQIHIQNYLEKSKLLDKESKLTSLLISAIQGQKQLVEMDCTSFDNRTKNPDSAAEAARTHILFFSLAVTYGCHTGLRSLSTDLSLSQYNDFMTDVELKRVLLVLGKGLVIPEGERDRNLILKQFGDLHEPMRISASNERPGDWTSCLSLMLSCGLMSSYNDKRNTTAVIGNLLQADFNMDMARNDTNSDSKGSATLSSNGTHSLMVRVLSRVRWPPHTQIKTCIDGWLVKCAGVMDANTIRIPTATGITTASTDKEDGDCGRIESRCLGLPLLINEARDLCMISSQRNSPSSLCHTLDTGFDISKRPIDIVGEAGRGGLAKFKNHNKYCTRKASSASLVAIESSFSDSVQSLIQSWGGLKRAADYVGDNEHFEEGDNDDDDQHQDCGYVSPLPSHSSSSFSSSSSYSQSVHIPTNKSHNSNGAGLCGVIACYAALHYASLSMHMDEVVGVSASISASRVAEIMYMGPFVCDFRSLPIKTSIQYLLHKLRQSQSSDSTSSSIIPTPSVSTSLSSYLAGNTIILYSLVKLVQELCPELLLSERSQCFRPMQIFPGNSSTVPNVTIKQSDDVSMNGDMIRSDVLLDFIEALISPKSEEKATPNHYSMACLLLAKSAFSTPHFISPTPTRIISSRLIQKLLSRASENKQSTQVSAGLWSIWRAVHSHYSLPQEIELITINHLINERMLEFHFRVLTSYEQLVQEPLLLFALPYPVLSEMFTLRLVIFITRAALCASRRAVHFALRLKHKTAEGFLTGGLRHRSVTEASLYLHEQTYIDLQELMAVRLVLGLWERWGDDEFASTRRLVLNDFLAALIADNPHLVNLLLCNQLTPRSFELLMSCDTAVAAAMSSCHLQDLQSTTLALKTLPQQSALVVDQSITSSSLLYTTSVTAASLLATDLEISPEYVERLLLHSLCLLKMMKYLGCDRSIPKDNKNLEKSILSIQLLAEALPPFLVSATNSLNKNLRSKEVKSIELYSEAIISYLYMFHPVCVTAFKNFISCTDKIVTANTAAIGLAMKAPGGKAHVRDDDSVVGGRPAIIALKKIIQRIDSSHLQPQRDPLVREEGNHNQQHVSSVTSAVGQGGTGDTLIGAVSHKTNRSVEDCHGTSDEYPGRKKSRIGTQSSE